MKNKILLPILLLAAMTVTGCGKQPVSSSEQPGPASSDVQPTTSEEQPPVSSEDPVSSSEAPSSSEDPVTYGVAINNKAQLTGEWYKGTTRDLDVTLTPAANALQEIQKGNLTITSSDPTIVAVTGLGLSALKKGEATITVKYHDATDSVAVNILSNSAIDKYGVAHEGTAEDPFTNEDALAVAKSDKYEGEDYYVKGEVASFYHTPGERTDGVVSWFLKPATAGGEQFEIYKCLKQDGSFLTAEEIWKGGTAVAHGKFTVYNGQYETTAATFVSCEGNKPGARQEIAATVAEVLTVGKALVDGDSAYDYYLITGYVVKNSGTNYFLADSKTAASDDKDMFEIYNASADGLADKLLKNAKITIKAVIKNYHNQVETCLPVTNDSVTVHENGQPWVINYQEKTVTEALTIINGLQDGKTADGYYAVTGYVAAVTGAYNADYGNMSFTIGETADATDLLTCFRVKTDADTAATVVAGAKVLVKGQLQKYVKNSVITPELINSEFVQVIDEDAPVLVSLASLSFNKDATVVIDNKLEDATDPYINYTSTSGVSIDVRKNTSSSNVNVWKADYTSCRWYVGHKVTISSAKAFSKVELTCDSGYREFKAESDGTTITALKALGATVEYDSAAGKIIITFASALSTFDLVPDKQIRPSNVELFGEAAVTPTPAEVVLPIIAKGNQDTKVEGAGAWIYIDTTGLSLTAEMANAMAAAAQIQLTVAMSDETPDGVKDAAQHYVTGADAAVVVVADQVRFDDFGTNTVRLYVGMDKGLDNSWKMKHTFQISIPLDATTVFVGSVEFIGGALTKINDEAVVAPVEIAQPIGNFSGYAVNASDDSNIFVDIALGDEKAFVEVGSLLKDQFTYTFNKATGLVTIALGGNFGNLTATFDEANSKLINVGVDGAAAAMLKNNGTMELVSATKFWDCNGTTAELQAQFKRRYMSGSWQVDTSNADRFVSYENGIAGSAMQRRGWTGGAVAVNLAEDMEAVEVSNLGVWVYNSSANDITLRMWIYKGAGLTDNAELGSGLVAKANSWTYIRIGFTKAAVRNFQIADFTNSGVALVFDNICLF